MPAELHRLSRADSAKLAKQIGAPSGAHIRCAIAALVGAVCALPGKLVGDLATAVGNRVAAETGSPLAGKMASALVTRWLTNIVLQASPLSLVDKIGVLADLAAVDACPSQRNTSGKRHHEVEDCESRIEKRTIEQLLEAGS